jgi:hypothetical protein
MFFNEEDIKQATEIETEKDLDFQDIDIGLDSAGESQAAGNAENKQGIDDSTIDSDATVDLDLECGDGGDLGFGDMDDDPLANNDRVQLNGFDNKQTVDLDLDLECGDCGDDSVDEDVAYSFGDIPDDAANIGTDKIHDNFVSEDIDLSFEPISDTEQTDQEEDTVHEDIDLDYEELKKNGFNVDATAWSHEQGVDLDFDINNQTSQEDTVHEDIDLSFEPISDSNQTDQEDGIHEEEDIKGDDEVSPALGESMVRIFPRKSYNLIMESDVKAVVKYYGNKISKSDALSLIAECHNIEKDSLKICR